MTTETTSTTTTGTPVPQPPISADQLTQRAVFLRVARKKVGVRRKAKAVQVDRQTPISANAFADGVVVTDAQPEMISVNKKILDCAEYTAICSLDNEVRRYLETVMLRTSLSGAGIYPIAVGTLDEVYAKLDEFKARRQELVDAFLAVYEERCAESDAKLGSLANAADHPPRDQVAATFYFDWQPLSFDVPGALRHLRRERYEAESRRIQAQLQDAAAEIQQGLRQAFAELVQHMTGALAPTKEDGSTKKKFYGSRLTQLTAFLERFKDRNITDDADLAQLATQAQALLDGVDAEMIRDNDDLRLALQEEFGKLQGQLDGMVGAAPRRMIALEE